MPKTIERKLKDIIDFNISKTNNSNFTKSFISEHKGNVPVYGASLNESEVSYGFVEDNLPTIKYFDDCLTWNIDGSVGIFYRQGHFSLSEKVIPLIPKKQYINTLNLLYLKYAIKYSKELTCYNFSNKAGKNKLKEISINIPVLDNGMFDLKTQNELALKFQDVENKNRLLLKKAEYLKNCRIVFDNSMFNLVEVPLNTLITHYNGKSTYTKDFCQQHKGSFPVYSANNNEPIGYINTADHCGNFLSYSKNGCAGYISIMTGSFSANGDRCVLKLNRDYKNIDLLYLKYYLEPIFRANIKGRIGVNGKNEYTKINSTMIKKLNITVPIPIKPDGSYDLEKQQELAHKYASIDSIKNEVYSKIRELTNISVK